MFVSNDVRASLFLYCIVAAMTLFYCTARLYKDNDFGVASNNNEYQTFSYGGIAHAFVLLAIGVRMTNLLLADRAASFAEFMALGMGAVFSVSAVIIYYVSDDPTGPDWMDKFSQVYLASIALINCSLILVLVRTLVKPSKRDTEWELPPILGSGILITAGTLVIYVIIVAAIMMTSVGDAMWSYSIFVIGLPSVYVGTVVRTAALYNRNRFAMAVRGIAFAVAVASLIFALTRNSIIHEHTKVGGFTIWLFDIGFLVLLVADATVWVLCEIFVTAKKKGSDDIPLLDDSA